jgi:hypothetical protein
MNHVGDRGRPVPSRLGTDHELEYLAGVMGSTGRGIVELTIGGSRPDRVAEVDRYMELARTARRPVTMVSVRHNPVRPDEHRQILAKVEAAWREGLRLHPQGTCSPLTSTFTITKRLAWRQGLAANPRPGRRSGAPSSPTRASAPSSARASATPRCSTATSPCGSSVVNPVPALRRPERVEMARDTGKDVIDAFLDWLADDSGLSSCPPP